MALAYIEKDLCKLVSRNEYDYKRFPDVAAALPSAISARNAILDGELVVLDRSGKAQFYDLVVNRGRVVFAAFDLVWLNGRDMRDLTLLECKETLRYRLRFSSSHVIFVDHIQGRGKAVYQQICKIGSGGHGVQADDQSMQTGSRQDDLDQGQEPELLASRRTRGVVQQTT